MLTTLTLLLGLAAPAMADGACCLDSTTPCTIESGRECASADGYFYGDDSTCDDAFVECPGSDPVDTGETDPDTGVEDPRTGACCVDDACFELASEACAERSGYFYGLGSDCIDSFVECESDTPGTGACCIDGACVDTTIEGCHASAGYWYGLGVPCSDPTVECTSGGDDTGSSGDDTGAGGDDTGAGGDDTGAGGDDTGAGGDDPQGACCLDGECILTTAEKCWGDLGAFYGPDSDCEDDFVECYGNEDTGGTGIGPVDSTDAAAAEPCKGGCSTAGGNIADMVPVALVALLALVGTGRRRENA